MAVFVETTATNRVSPGSWAAISPSGLSVAVWLEVAALYSTSVRVAARFKRGSSTYLIVPDNILPGSTSAKFVIPSIVLKTTDSIEVFNDAACDWKVGLITQAVPDRQFSNATSTSGDTWVEAYDAASKPATIHGLTAAVKSSIPALVSMQVQTTSGARTLMTDEEIPGLGSRRKTPVVSLALGEKLMVKSKGNVDWVFSGATQ